MFSEDLQTVLIDVFESICSPVSNLLPNLKIVGYLHTGCTSSDFPSLLQAV